MGSSSVTGDETILFADNMSFDGTQRGGKLTADGQLFIGSTASPHVRKGSIGAVAGGGLSIVNGSGSIAVRMLTPYTLGDFTFQNNNSATKRTLESRNNDTNIASEAVIRAVVVNGSSACPYLQVGIGATQVYCWGIDPADSNSLKVCSGANSNTTIPSGTTLVYKLTAGGIPSYPQAGWTTDGVLYSLANGVLASTAAGTVAQVLTSNGAGVAPTYQNGGSLILISRQTASASASIIWTGLATYNHYVLIVDQARPTTGGDNMLLQISIDNGSTYISTGYLSGFNAIPYNSTLTTNTNLTSSFILAANVNNTGVPACIEGRYDLYNFLNAVGQTSFSGNSAFNDASNIFNNGSTVGTNNNASAVTAIKIFCTSSNILTGRFALYGIAGS